MKKSILLIFLICLGAISCNDNAISSSIFNTGPKITEKPALDTSRFASKAQEALQYATSQRMSTNRCILIDMSIHSGRNRWVEWDFNNNSIVSATVVTHGCGTRSWANDKSKNQPGFSNIPDSHLSSLGRYKIGNRGVSQWGIGVKYLLHGLDTSNSNALKRFIVLHSWDKVADKESYPTGAPESWGCPAVSNEYMSYIDLVLQKEEKPVLMWIYYQ